MVIIPLVLAFSCSINPDRESIQKTFSTFVSGVQKGDFSGWTESAPFLSRLDPSIKETTLRALQKRFQENPQFSIELIDANNARVILSDKNRTLFPFKKGTDGRWTISEYLETKQTIDFIPRK